LKGGALCQVVEDIFYRAAPIEVRGLSLASSMRDATGKRRVLASAVILIFDRKLLQELPCYAHGMERTVMNLLPTVTSWHASHDTKHHTVTIGEEAGVTERVYVLV
jgi:hypothetical protein